MKTDALLLAIAALCVLLWFVSLAGYLNHAAWGDLSPREKRKFLFLIFLSSAGFVLSLTFWFFR